MFLLLSLTGASTSPFDEKKAGLYQRLLAAPVRRTHILWSKYIFGILLGVVQLLTLFVAGRVLFGVDITSNVFNLLLICLAAASACVAFGMLLAALAPTAAAANGMGTLLILTMSAVGGAWWPTSFMPQFMQQWQQVHDRLFVDRRLPPRAFGKLQHARAAPGARHPARLRCRREHDQHLAFSPRADLRVANTNSLRALDAQRVGRQDL